MNRPATRLHGHTILEVVIAFMLLTVAGILGINGWAYMLRGERRNSTQCELDMQVRSAVERIRSEVRLTTMDRMVFHPAGAGPYTAISFAMAADTNGDGLVEMKPGGTNILWQKTVIYHISPGSPNRLLRTEFSPRDDTLTRAQLEQQLAYVVTNGNGTGTYGGANARTMTVFNNFFTWQVEPRGATFDAYSPTLTREFVDFGSTPLASGSHQYTFTITGKNDLSTGIKFGLDTLTPTVCGAAREAEDIPYSASGTVTRAYMPQGSWSGNNQLLFSPACSGAVINLTAPNDLWEESGFRTTGSVHDRTTVVYDSPDGRGDVMLTIDGSGETWRADEQTHQPAANTTSNTSLRGAGVRVLLRGGDIPNGGFIRADGRMPNRSVPGASWYPGIYLRVPRNVVINDFVTIARASGTPPHFDIRPGSSMTLRTLRPSSDPDVVLAWNYWYAQPYVISKTNSYLVSFIVDKDTGAADVPYWQDNQTASAILPDASYTNLAMVSWSNATLSTRLYAVESLFTCYPASGVYQSAVFDTLTASPVYSTLAWESAPSTLPSGVSVSLQARSGSLPDLSDAPAWSGVPVATGNGSYNAGSGRYVQFRASLLSDTYGLYAPSVRRVQIAWPAEKRVVSVAGMVTKGPDYGSFELKVDNAPLVKGLRFMLSIYKDLQEGFGASVRLTSDMTFEVDPRNAGK